MGEKRRGGQKRKEGQRTNSLGSSACFLYRRPRVPFQAPHGHLNTVRSDLQEWVGAVCGAFKCPDCGPQTQTKTKKQKGRKMGRGDSAGIIPRSMLQIILLKIYPQKIEIT